MRANFIGMAFGVQGAGKSHLLRTLLAQFPRVLTFDVTTERVEQYPDAIAVYSVQDLLDALQDFAAVRDWHLIACVDQKRIPAIFDALAPENMHASQGYSRAIGGMCVEIPEIDTVVPNGQTDDVIRGAFQRGRHYRLSILGDTQRPAFVDRAVTMLSHALFCFQTHEPRDIKYLAQVIGVACAARLPSLERWHHVRYVRGQPGGHVIDPTGKAIESISPGTRQISLRM